MITIVDYQMGNLRSVQKAIQRVGGEAKISSDPNEIANAEQLVLPGVGAFGDAMAEINRRDLAAPIQDFCQTGRPFLGICLGLQLLFEEGFEHGTHKGLGILTGDVVRFELPDQFKVPHMGWNTVKKQASCGLLDDVLLDDLAESTHFYFVHSYYVRPADPAVVALTCDYGIEFCAMVAKGNLFATQFHPEKSQTNGLQLLRRFTQLGNNSPASLA
ncbi:imidazole glycerol phosphate synthase subunit HisH [Rhodopirellula sp. MGV]|uniref:imidazole glycerol phosphate synthase subunit HisH n=1 Tax=Rhodopirellula sp. MGV TaxID=2023130 RepID=UPI000B9666DF|nr:imidazole glycerol phosphate synthase subunit HisH [Rhodopirellula sp. MGV]OYP35446.1 imidazole glycerol phosphate synthase subunit HisH [Rhodopirellula sp. MGV]PNY33886.1 imidazole glycerol phosphate synthase subunit HisH [Rhodopirellula baltica]